MEDHLREAAESYMADLVNEVEQLRKENGELKERLDDYRHAAIDRDLDTD
jgi:regulator of replication initiation timing